MTGFFPLSAAYVVSGGRLDMVAGCILAAGSLMGLIALGCLYWMIWRNWRQDRD